MNRAFLFILLLSFPAAVRAAGGPALTFSGDYSAGGRSIHTIGLTSGGVRCTVLHGAGDGIPDYARCCVSTPYILAGSLCEGGIIREMADPAGFGVNSDVYSVFTGYRRDTSPPKSGPAGLVGVLDLGTWLFQFPVLLGPEPVRGICAAFLRPGVLQAGGACISARVGATAPAERWLSEAPDVPDQTVSFAAVSAAASLPGVDMTAASGVSLPEYSRQGWFLRGRVHLENRLLDAALLAAFCSPGYLPPDGRYPRDRNRYSVFLTLFRGDSLEFFYDAERIVRRESLIPDTARGVEERNGGGLALHAGAVDGEVSLRRVVVWEADGSGHVRHTLTLEAEYDGSFGSLSGDLRFRRVDAGETVTRIRIGAVIEMTVLECDLTFRYDVLEGPRGGIAVSWRSGPLKAGLSLDSDGNSGVALSLGS